MGRYHSTLLQTLFPNQRGTGIDLGNIEIKESTSKYNRIELKKEDYNAEYILAYNHQNEIFLLVDTNDIPRPIKTRFKMKSISWNWLEKYALFSTQDEIEMLEQIKNYLSNPEVFVDID